MEPIRTLVCDDEPDAREGILELLRGDPEIAVVGEARTGVEAVSAIDRSHPDLVFLDVQMPELDGFGVLTAVGADRMPVVVFVTAYDEYALRAFDVHALDYLLKPFSDSRFAEAVTRAKEQVRQRRVGELGQQLAALLQHAADDRVDSVPQAARREDMPTTAPRYLERITVRTSGRLTFIPVDDIDWIAADDYYAKLHIAGRTHLIRETMQQLEAKLDPRRFVRVHRSAIVNIDRIQALEPYFRGTHVITLKDGTRVRLSRSGRRNLERSLGWQL